MRNFAFTSLLIAVSMTGVAMADSAGVAAGGGLMGILGQFLPLIIIFAIFYFLVIKPQQKKQEEHRQKIESIVKGDEVVTAGGIIAKVHKVSSDDNFIEIEIAESVIAKVAKHTIAEVMPKAKKEKKAVALKKTFAKNTKKKSEAKSSATK